jgi:hypothetical protein
MLFCCGALECDSAPTVVGLHNSAFIAVTVLTKDQVMASKGTVIATEPYHVSRGMKYTDGMAEGC